MSLLMAASMLTVLMSTQPVEEVSAANDYGLADNVQDGQILQCFDWSYNNIKNNMSKIAEQGFSTIQTSPIQQAKEGTKGSDGGHWWVYYQPAYWRIDDTGNSALGTKAEFKAMVEEAHKYGVKVIVDAVLNHTGNISDAGGIASTVDPDIKNDSSCWHTTDRSTNDYNNRWEVTQLMMGGLPDLNTGHQKVQAKSIEFLKECIDCGVDGFRFDGTKHIETPEDDSSYRSDFWPNVLGAASDYAKSQKNKTLFYYGEILDAVGGSLSVTAYTKYMSVTDNETGNNIRNAVNNRDASGAAVSTFSGKKSGLSPSKAVIWNESHDTWCHTDNTASGWCSTRVMKQTWALTGSRAQACGMYFARPHGSNEKNISTPLGQAETDTGWADPEVKAVNQFKNYFIGQSEYLSSSGSFAYNERGTEGVVIVNCNNGSASVNIKANKMKDGTYKDQITGNTFTVSGGQISGQMGDTGIAVVYNPTDAPVRGGVSATPATGTTFTTDTLSVTLGAKDVTNAKYTTSEGDSGSYTDGQKITVGASTAVGGTVKVTLSGTKSDGSTATAEYTYTKKDQSALTSIYFDNSSYNWSGVYAYIYTGEGASAKEVAKWPGTAMTKDSSTGYYKLDVPSGFESGRVIFTENADATTNRYPADQIPGLEIGDSSKLFKAGNTWENYTSAPPPIPDKDPTVTSSQASGSSFTTETYDVTLGLANAVSGTYSVDNGPTKTFTSSTKVTIGEGKIGDSDVTIKATATNDKGTTKNYTFTYKKTYVKKTSSTKTLSANAAARAVAATAASSSSLASYYKTNAVGKGSSKTITVDGDVSDWDSSMLIAQGAANDDPRVYRPNSMYEIPYDAYALYGAWDDTNLYLMIEMTNVQDVVAPNDNYPMGSNATVDNIPMFIYIDTGKSDAIGNNGKTQKDETFWGCNTTVTSSFNRVIAMSSGVGKNGPYIYGGDSTGINPVELGNSTTSGIVYKTGKGILSKEVWGINGAYGEYNNRVIGDMCSDSADWVDFNTKGHNSATMDYNYEVSIPLSQLGITKSDIENSGIGVLFVHSSGASGMDCIPYDITMNDNADQSDPASNPENSFEKGDEDNITTSFARIGNGSTPPPPPDPTLPLQVNFGADRSAPQEAGTALTLKGIGYGGSGSGYKYEFIVDGTTVQASSSKDSYTWNLTGGQHTIKCIITDSKGATATTSKTYTAEGGVDPQLPLKNNSTISATTINKGSSVTMKAAATGGTAPYTYTYLCQSPSSSSYTTLKTTTATSYKHTPTSAGTYYYAVKVTDAAGDSQTKKFTVTVKATTTALANNSTISATSINLGSSIKLTAKATGGTAPYKYVYFYRLRGDLNWTALTGTTTATKCTHKPNKAANYQYAVRVFDSTGKYLTKTFDVNVKKVAALANTSTISATSINLGSSIKLTAKATGGTAPYKYKYFYRLRGDLDWTSLTGVTTATTCTHKPTKAVSYQYAVRVFDSTGKNLTKTFNVNVKKVAALANASTISATSINLGSSIKLTAKATGGTAPYKYVYFYRLRGDLDWTALTGTTTATTCTHKPTKAANYQYAVRVFDSTGKYLTKTFNVTVNKAAELANTSTISATSINLGSSIKLTAKATGGTTPYKYVYFYRLRGALDWTALTGTTTATTCTHKPTKAANYQYAVRVFDSTGKSLTKTFNVTVK